MRNLWRTFLAISLLLAIILQAPGPSEAKKAKKAIKELKKLKKYAYLLAANKKKLYAIPFPMPMPVFVKRQQIYTQVPIIPRYVQQPQAYSAQPEAAPATTESSAGYELMSGSYAPEVRVPSSSAYYSPKGAYSAAQSYGPSSMSSRKRPSYSSAAGSPYSSGAGELAQQYLGSSGAKYLSQIAGLLGQASPSSMGSSGTTNRDLLTKLLTGQARVLPPTALLSTITKPSSYKPQNQEHQQHKQQEDQEHYEQDSKAHHQGPGKASGWSASTSAPSQSTSSSRSPASSQPASSSGSPGSDSVQFDEQAAGSSSSRPADHSAAAEDKPAASELYRSAMALRHMRPPYAGPPIHPYQLQALLGPMMSPMAAALAAASRAQAMQRAPLLRPPLAAFGLMPMMDPYEGSNQLDSAQDPQEAQGSSPQDHETVSSEHPSAQLSALLRQRQHLQQRQQIQEQRHPDHVLMALQRVQRQQLLARQQEALRIALLREHEVAARLAESRQIRVRAHQLGLPPSASLQPEASHLLRHYKQLVA